MAKVTITPEAQQYLQNKGPAPLRIEYANCGG